MYKECNVVILSTKEKAPIKLLRNTLYPLDYFEDSIRFDYQHLYITSDGEIKEGDWCIDLWNNKVIQMDKATKDMLDAGMLHNPHALIIATTDKLILDWDYKNDIPHGDLYNKFLPTPSLEWIKYYIEQHNQGNVITKVIVEYKRMYLPTYEEIYLKTKECTDWELKVNSDNTINIKSIKDSWSREEHIQDIKRIIILEREYRDKCHHFIDIIDLEDFINKYV